MRAEHPIRYLRDKSAGLELILCRDSSISYPLHNHASVFTVGLVLRGCVFLCKRGKDEIESNIRHLLAVCGSEWIEAHTNRLLLAVDSLGRARPSTNAARGIPRQCLLLLSGVFKKIVFNN